MSYRIENIEFWMTVHGYVKLSRLSLKIDILFLRSCLFFGMRTIRRHCRMICVTWYISFANTVLRAALTRDRPEITKRKASRNLTGHSQYHQKRRTWTRNLGKC